MARSKRSSRRSSKRRRQMRRKRQSGGNDIIKNTKSAILYNSIYSVLFGIYSMWDKYERCEMFNANIDEYKFGTYFMNKNDKTQINNFINLCSSKMVNINYVIELIIISLSIVCIINIDNIKLSSKLILVNEIIRILKFTYEAFIIYKTGKVAFRQFNIKDIFEIANSYIFIIMIIIFINMLGFITN